jgi:hypothetical protein
LTVAGTLPIVGRSEDRAKSDRGRSSAGRASRSQCEGQGFDPPRLHHPQIGGAHSIRQLGERFRILLIAWLGYSERRAKGRNRPCEVTRLRKQPPTIGLILPALEAPNPTTASILDRSVLAPSSLRRNPAEPRRCDTRPRAHGAFDFSPDTTFAASPVNCRIVKPEPARSML